MLVLYISLNSFKLKKFLVFLSIVSKYGLAFSNCLKLYISI